MGLPLCPNYIDFVLRAVNKYTGFQGSVQVIVIATMKQNFSPFSNEGKYFKESSLGICFCSILYYAL
jgi:hypothetical protein